MAIVVPVIDANGFVTDINLKADHALSNFYITQRSQTDHFRGSVTSLADIIRRFGNNPMQLQEHTQAVLEVYLGSQFEAVDLTVTATTTGPSINLQIEAILRDGANAINLVHAVTATNSIIKSIIDLQNDGKEIIPADTIGR